MAYFTWLAAIARPGLEYYNALRTFHADIDKNIKLMESVQHCHAT